MFWPTIAWLRWCPAADSCCWRRCSPNASAIVHPSEFPKPRCDRRRERALAVTPAPVASEGRRLIHARFTAQAEHVLKRDENRVGHRRFQRADEVPMYLRTRGVEIRMRELPFAPDRFAVARAFATPFAAPQSHGSIAVVCAGVGHHVARKIVRAETRALRIVAESELQNAHAGQVEPGADGF